MKNRPTLFSAVSRPAKRLVALLFLLCLPITQAAEQPATREAPRTERLTLSWQERDWLDEHSPIRVGNTPDWVPIEFFDEQGHPDGVAIDYVRRVESLLGIQVEFVQVKTWNELIEKVHADEVDLLPSTAITENRSDFLSFTQPYLSQPIVLFARDSTDYLFDLSHLSNRRFGVVENFAAIEWIQRDYPSVELVPAATIDDMLRDLISGRTDACVDSVLTVSYAIRKGRYSTIKVAGDTPYTIELSMAARSELSRLPALLDKALTAIGKDEQQAILDKWLSVRYEQLPGWAPALKWILIAIGLLIVLLLLALGWSHVLRRAVSRRTEELNSANRALRDLQSKMEAIYNHHYQMTGLMNADGQLLMSNKTALQFAGTTAEHMTGKSLWEAPGWSHSKNATQLRDEVRRAQNGEFVQFEAVLISPQGAPRDFALCITPVFGDDGRVIYMVPEGYDITDRKRAPAALHESEVRLRNLSDNLPGGMTYQIDSGTQGELRKFTYVSAGIKTLHELSEEAVLKDAKLLYSQILDEDQPLLAKQQNLALTAMQPFAAEVRFRLPSGAVRWRLLNSAPRRDHNGHLIWDGIELDITEKKKRTKRGSDWKNSSDRPKKWKRSDSSPAASHTISIIFCRR